METGGIDPARLMDVMRRQGRMGDAASARDLVRAIEDMISESLIVARQQGAGKVRLLKEADGSVVAHVAEDGGADARLVP